MRLNSSWLGSHNVSGETAIDFPAGIPGFEHSKRFQLIHDSEGAQVVHWLQSLDDPELTLPVVDPTTFGLAYDLPLNEGDASLLDLEPNDDLLFLLVISDADGATLASTDPREVRIRPHLRAPLVINARSRRGLQMTLPSLDYGITLRLPEATPP